MSTRSLTESQFQSRVLKFLQDEGAYFIKYWGGGRFTKAGVPDIICCVSGLFVGVELKTETGRVAKLQEYNIEKIRESGGISFVLRPSQFSEFQRFIREVKRCNLAIPEFPPSNSVGGDSSSSTSTSSKPSQTKRRTTR